MNEEKVYYPDTISDTPLPNQTVADTFNTTDPITGENQSPAKIKNNNPPSKRIATELLSASLNTKSKKILAEFEFTVNGALAIGTYEPGVSGDVRISPNGIVARNDQGLTTFTLDGTSGDAVFAGTIQSGTIVAGTVLVGDGSLQLDGENSRYLVFINDIAQVLVGKF